MILRIKDRFYQSSQALLNILGHKIINLKIINNVYIQFINELNHLYDQYEMECQKLNRPPLDEETKIFIFY